MSNRLLDQPWLQNALGGVVGGYMAFCDRTARWEERGRPYAEPFFRGPPMVLAVWHGRLLQMQHAWPVHEAARPCHVLVSRSREGRVIGRAAQALGHKVIHGSTAKAGKDKGAVAALREILRRLANGDPVAITPDGPKGPRMRASLGVIQVAKLSGAPILPASWSMAGAVAAGSWDRMLQPRPFGRGVHCWGEPITVPRDASDALMEAKRRELEATLNRLTADADAACGVGPIGPEALP